MLVLMGSHHKLVPGSRPPIKKRRWLCQMEHDLSVNVAVQLLLQSVLMQMSEEWARPDTM